MIFPRRRGTADPVEQLAARMASGPGSFVAEHPASGWLARWLEEAMQWPAGCGHTDHGTAESPLYAFAGRRWCSNCVGVFNDPWCVRCDTDADTDIWMVQAQQGLVLVVFGLCPGCHQEEMGWG